LWKAKVCVKDEEGGGFADVVVEEAVRGSFKLFLQHGHALKPDLVGPETYAVLCAVDKVDRGFQDQVEECVHVLHEGIVLAESVAKDLS
jgi:hypothetical protein